MSILIFLSLSVQDSINAEIAVIKRLNYGFVLQPRHVVTFQTDTAKIAFVIDLPVPNNQTERVYDCDDLRGLEDFREEHATLVGTPKQCRELVNVLN